MERTIALAACLALALALGWLGEQGPRPLPADAPAEAFSSARAFEDIKVIARAPHPTGTPANFAVRDHLTSRMAALGLSPRVVVDRPFSSRVYSGRTNMSGGRVENVIGVLPGRDPAAPALGLMAHYDSVAGSPGAADDAAGVAAALEIVRAFRARGQPERDVVLIMTDGEEAGLLGAQAFFQNDPLAARIGFVINMEARGSAGRANMFETGPDNGPTIDLFIRTSPGSPSNALAVFAYEQMPNDTDFSVPRRQGIPGLNYAFVGRQFDYHSPTSTVENLSARSVQDLGDQSLAAAVAVAYSDTLPGQGPNRVYARTFAGHMLAYPPVVGWAVIAAAILLLTLAGLQARKSSTPLRWLDAGQGVLAGLYVLVAGAIVLRFARRASGAGFGFLEQHLLLAQAARFEAVLILLALGVVLLAAAALAKGGMRLTTALAPLAAALGCQIFGDWDLVGLALGVTAAVIALAAFGRAAERSSAWVGLLASGVAGAIALQILAPTTAFLIAWPMLVAAGAAALSGLGERRPLGLRLALIILCGAGLGWLAGMAHAVFVSLDMVELLALTAWLAAFFLWPFAHPKIGGAGRVTALLVLGSGLALLALMRVDPPWSERHPRATLAYYLVDQTADKAYRVEAAPTLSDWSRRALNAPDGDVPRLEAPPLPRGPVWATPAPMLNLPSPSLELDGGGGRLVFSAAAPPAARILVMDVRVTGEVGDVRLNGQPAPLFGAPGAWARLSWTGDTQPLQISFTPVAAQGRLEVRYGAITESWPTSATPLPPRPPKVMAFDTSDSLITRGEKAFSW
ncbi:M20/M25/M40 family metallo-hydrolase [Phenylobacterium sp.]|uniref:M20/M25/M40 family metallo-hydrolase n=1 Tax=Phenylobacterium sp. TaxID=1871053 RepID=UPI0027319B68|nr:M20/M25/M40 family metallo-hydrolase [Phenylobacterium sp.]MDP1617005.1 M20/M25/M40 family metallo-hydrolase [Phenylobacterium sp.]MDP1985820.1 M20/M25/M40 family metallo-hydrolase [Phenylobacterium sp.]